MENMKRIIILSFLLIMFVSMFGCDQEPAAPVDTDTDLPAETTAATEPEIIENRFILQSDGYNLDAVYTYVDDGQKHPTVLLIADSGPQDYDETYGSLKPLADIAAGLADNGINSLRVDKRTKDYIFMWVTTYGVEEEYLIDCRTALGYIKSQDSCGEIWLLGQGLGGQIAALLAAEDESVCGLILFGSSARSLAAIICDRYCRADNINSEQYKKYRDAAISATAENAGGYSYYGGSDFYWATLNKINTIQNINDAALPTLIINSKNDTQLFDADIKLWSDSFSGVKNVELYVDEASGFFGYDIAATDKASLITTQTFPQWIIDLFVNFIMK
jgi:pimeloyl-ACP methyl ester carboxylesterase